MLAKYTTEEQFNEAKESGIDYFELSVIGIFYEVSEQDNPAFDAILSNYESCQYPHAVEDNGVCNMESFGMKQSLKLENLIPMDGLVDNGFFSYEGSLTTPMCTPIGM